VSALAELIPDLVKVIGAWAVIACLNSMVSRYRIRATTPQTNSTIGMTFVLGVLPSTRVGALGVNA